MNVELVAYTQPNPALTPENTADRGDLASIPNGHGPFPEQLIEYAGRVCYRSTHRMGTAPEFISARVREGHEDIIEHVVVTLRVRNSVEPLRWRTVNRHCEVSDVGDSRVDRQRQHARLAGFLSPGHRPGGVADPDGHRAQGLRRV